MKYDQDFSIFYIESYIKVYIRNMYDIQQTPHFLVI